MSNTYNTLENLNIIEALQGLDIESRLLQTTMQGNSYASFMSQDFNSPIVMTNIAKGNVTKRLGISLPGMPAKTLNHDESIGSIDSNERFTYIDIESKRIVNMSSITREDLLRQISPIDVLQNKVQVLETSITDALEENITNAFTKDLYNFEYNTSMGINIVPEDTENPNENRMVLGLGGKIDKNLNKTIASLQTKQGSGMTFKLLNDAIFKARLNKRRAFKSIPLQVAYTRLNKDDLNVNRSLIALLSSTAYQQLEEDMAEKRVQGQFLSISDRGIRGMTDFRSSSSYRCTINGVDVYSWDLLDDYTLREDNKEVTTNKSWSVILGGSAVIGASYYDMVQSEVLDEASKTKVKRESKRNFVINIRNSKDDYDSKVIIMETEVGFTAPKFNINAGRENTAPKNLEFGVVHMFTNDNPPAQPE